MSEYKYLVGCDEQGNVTPNAQVPTRAKYVEPQSAAGTLALDASRETFYDTITATGPLVITFTGTRLGSGILLTIAGTQSITVAGVPVVAGQVVALAGENWRVIQSGIVQSGTTTSTLTVGSLSAVAGTDLATLTVSGALDTGGGLATQPYRFSKDGGTTWTAWQASPTYQFTGLTPSTSSTTSNYQFRHQARNIAGEQRSGATVTKSMGVVLTWTTFDTITFTAPDNTPVYTLTSTGGRTITDEHRDKTLVVKSNRGYRSNNEGFYLNTGPDMPKARVSLDYDMSTGDEYSVVWVGAAEKCYLSVKKNGEWSIVSNGNNWSGTTASGTGAPTTGTASVEFDTATGTGSARINGTEVTPLVRNTGTRGVFNPGGRVGAAYIDNFKVEVA